MTFDDWMRARNPKYIPTDDTVALRELRDCWRAAEYHSERAQERELMIELMRDKCRKVGAGGTAKCHECGWVSGFHDKRCSGYLVDPETGEPIPTHNAELRGRPLADGPA